MCVVRTGTLLVQCTSTCTCPCKGAAEGHSLSSRQEGELFEKSQNPQNGSTRVLTVAVHVY